MPDHGFRLERRLEERFGSARFAYSTAYSALRPVGEGWARTRGARPAAIGRREVVYEATPEGVEHFRDWVRAPTSAPVLREELHAKIALCEPRDLPRLIDVVHAEESACVAELDRIRERMVAEQALSGSRTVAEQAWSELMDRGGHTRRSGLLGRADQADGAAARLSGGAAPGQRRERRASAIRTSAGGMSTVRTTRGRRLSELLRLAEVSKSYRRGSQVLHVLREVSLAMRRGRGRSA